MAIEKYSTKCFVIESYAQGENDRAYKLFTREFGLITVHAKSVRKLESKLRAHILPRTLSFVTIVKGKEVWRLVGAQELESVPEIIYEVTTLIKRFIRGEGTHKALYDRLIIFLEYAPQYDIQKARLLLYFILLVELGYADAKIIGVKDIKEYVSWSIDDLYTHLLLSHDAVRKHVQLVLQEMQL
jgi:recombinational DNA repair protein (RecF pathway)